MKAFGPSSKQWLLWFAAFAFLVAILLFPVSSRMIRIATLALAFVVWFGLIALIWRRRWLRLTLLGLTLLAGGFLLLPSRARPAAETLRTEFLERLQRYGGVRYYWGGENALGIDCSGLVRRGLMDAFFWRGVRTLDPGLVREALDMWWIDCTAAALGRHHRDLTSFVLETPSVNALDHAKIQPGDLAVTSNGVHIMAYLGDARWIEADPGEGRVIIVKAPASDNAWFHTPMRIVRWTALE